MFVPRIPLASFESRDIAAQAMRLKEAGVVATSTPSEIAVAASAG